MNDQLQLALITYAVPALTMLVLGLRRRRIAADVKSQQIYEGAKVSDWEIGQQLRDEIRADNKKLQDRVTELEEWAETLETRITVLSNLCLRHGIPVPEWAREA